MDAFGVVASADPLKARILRKYVTQGGVTPTYVFGRPAGESEETAEQFKQLVEVQVQSGREVWQVPLPFSVSQNERFTDAALKEGVRAMIKANRRWGVP